MDPVIIMTKKQKLTFILGLSLLSLISHAYALSDIEGATFQQEIEFLLEQGVVSGHPDGTYRPLDHINRAEFSKIVAEAAFGDEIDPGKTHCFPDVKTEWFAKYVCLLKEKGVIHGYPSGEFIPANNINFAESAKIVANGFSLNSFPLQPGQEWYQPFINTLSDHNATPFNILGPDQKLDRGQMAYIIYSLIHPNRPPAGFTQINHCPWPALATYDYFKDSTKIYYTPMGDYGSHGAKGFPTLEGADAATFEVLACEVFKDANNVFSLTKKTNYDAATFKLLSSQNFEFGLLYTYGQDKNGIYYFQNTEQKPISGVDAATFEVLEKGKTNPLGLSWYGFAKDKNRGYLEGVAIPGSDGASFALIGENIAYDKNRVYVSYGGLLRIYETLDPTPLLSMKELTFIAQSETFFENLNHQLYQTTQVARENAEDLVIEWYRG